VRCWGSTSSPARTAPAGLPSCAVWSPAVWPAPTLVISDAHVGLVDAVRSTLTGTAWQRCRTHFMRNLLTRVPKSAQAMVATLVRTIFAQPDAASVWEQHARVVDQLTDQFPAAAELLAEAAPDVLAFTSFPKEHWKQIWSNNPVRHEALCDRVGVKGLHCWAVAAA
jgi:transposase-like protein